MNVCPTCQNELKSDSQEFAYEQLFELMKLEESRRGYLDSKANTYIGLLSIAVTVLTAFGGVLTFRGDQIQEIKNLKLDNYSWILFFIYFFYILIIILFMLSVIFAFRAYATGSKEITTEPKKYCSKEKWHNEIAFYGEKLFRKIINKLDLLLLPDRETYLGMPAGRFAENKDKSLSLLRNQLITTLNNLVLKNNELNDKKANRILAAYRATVLGIFILILLTLIIGAIGIGAI